VKNLEFHRSVIIKKWEDSGLLDGLTLMSDKSNVAQLYESQASHLLKEEETKGSIWDTISYFENRIAGAQRPEYKIRPMQQLITIMMCNIIKKHCL